MSLRTKSQEISIDGRVSNMEASEDKREEPNWWIDKWNILILLFLYILQGIPMGLSASIPMVLQSRHVGYKQQAIFSFVSWPFSIKLLWAPIVDSIYSERIGRRKSWLVPMQYLIGVSMILLSYQVGKLLGDEGGEPNVLGLTVFFFLIYTFAATQDIAVDGWALTMLSRRNVGYASTCNTVGQTVGFFLGYTLFLAFESKEFCNTYLRSQPAEEGMVNLGEFVYFWGIVFIITTTLVWMLKKEVKDREKSNITLVYKELFHVLQLKPVIMYSLAHFTARIGMAAAESVAGLKLIEAGVPKEKLALIAIPIIPIQVFLPFVISRFAVGARPLDLWLRAYPFRLFMGVVFAAVVWITPNFGTDGEFSIYFYITIVLIFMVQQVASYSMFVTQIAFHARVSDPAIGGTYMTLLNTICNLGSNWPGTLALWFVDPLSSKSCEGVSDLSLDCDTKVQLEECTGAGGHCVTHWDGFYTECIICVLLGLLWLYIWRRRIKNLQNLEQSSWRVMK